MHAKPPTPRVLKQCSSRRLGDPDRYVARRPFLTLFAKRGIWMPKFSISTLLWIVCIFAIVIAVVITQRMLREKNAQLAVAAEEISTYRNELGKIDVQNSDQFYIRHFKDRYTSDTEFRWRIHVPDASNCNIFYSVGELPVDGFPQSRRSLIPNRLPEGPAELVLIVENREDHLDGPGDFRIGFYPEYEFDNSPPIQGCKMQSVKWMPWFRGTKCTYENPPFDTTTHFDLDAPYTIMKHYTTNESGELTGYMFWIEQIQQAPSPK